jgi:hypothetical protein
MCIEEKKDKLQAYKAPSLEFTVERSEVVHTVLQVAIARNTAVTRLSIPRPWVAATATGRHLEGARGTLPVLDRDLMSVSAAVTKPFLIKEGICHHWKKGGGLTGSGYTSSILG